METIFELISGSDPLKVAVAVYLCLCGLFAILLFAARKNGPDEDID